MRYPHGTLSWALIGCLAAGCGARSNSNQTAANSSDQAAPTAGAEGAKSGCLNPPENLDGPEGAVYQFLEAVRTGDDKKAEGMFTPKARERTKEMDIQVAPRGSDTARFELGRVEMLEEDGARVGCKWTDLNKDGQLRTDDMTWMVRKEPEGWRIAGMAATVFEGEPPLLLDFENPKETLEKLEMLRQEITRRATDEPRQAQRGEGPSDSVQR